MGGIFGGGGGGSAPAPSYGPAKAPAAYSPAERGAIYTSNYTQQTATPFLQSVLGQQTGQQPSQQPAQNNTLGLPSLQTMFNLPQRNSQTFQQSSGIQQLAPMAPYVGSTYRPAMSAIQSNLNNVVPSVILQQKQAAEAEAESLRNQMASMQNQYNQNNDYSGGG